MHGTWGRSESAAESAMLLCCCRFGELDDLKAVVALFLQHAEQVGSQAASSGRTLFAALKQLAYFSQHCQFTDEHACQIKL